MNKEKILLLVRKFSNTRGSDNEKKCGCLLTAPETFTNKESNNEFTTGDNQSENTSIVPTISSATFPGSISSSKNSLESENVTNRPKTEKKLHAFGLFAVVAMVFSAVAGSGVLATPQFVYAYTGNAAISLLIWFIYGIIVMVGALCYIELGLTFPTGGGEYMYLNEAFGALPAFLYQWASFLFV
ncbi:unnamed protein product [Orchesella dallaii]|uniref:Uncharacterized protein n=1 Tax=Orchesella dallaii TaxID=48710 RepID=A0ABP1RXE8_9HEXA